MKSMRKSNILLYIMEEVRSIPKKRLSYIIEKMKIIQKNKKTIFLVVQKI